MVGDTLPILVQTVAGAEANHQGLVAEVMADTALGFSFHSKDFGAKQSTTT